jgi:hypothetical protein
LFFGIAALITLAFMNTFLLFKNSRKYKCFFAFVFLLIANASSSAQDFTNRGTDFWTVYDPHEKISSGTSDMTLYFTSDDTATVYIYVGSRWL